MGLAIPRMLAGSCLKKFEQNPILMSVPESERFHALLNRTLGSTSNGAKWAKEALDPFHDVQLEVVGMSDDSVGRSVVFDCRKTFTIRKPALLAAGDWDAHIAFLPFVPPEGALFQACEGLDSAPTDWGSFGTNELKEIAAPGAALTSAPFQVCSVVSGDPTFLPGVASPDIFYDGVNIQEFFPATGATRVVGGAFEVHNVTATIAKQGSVTCYRAENKVEDCVFDYLNAAGTAVYTGGLSTVARLPPNNLESAKLMDGITWDAEEGALVPLVQNMNDNEPRRPTGRVGWVYLTPDQSLGFVPINRFVTSAQGPFMATYMPYMISGAYFTGLSDDTALELTVRVFIEHFPDAGSSLTALAKPSPSYDEVAIKVVSELQSRQLAGYKVGMNGAGDFFRGALGALRNVVSRVTGPLSALSTAVPQLQPMARMVETADAVLSSTKGKKKAKKPNGDGMKVQAGSKRA